MDSFFDSPVSAVARASWNVAPSTSAMALPCRKYTSRSAGVIVKTFGIVQTRQALEERHGPRRERGTARRSPFFVWSSCATRFSGLPASAPATAARLIAWRFRGQQEANGCLLAGGNHLLPLLPAERQYEAVYFVLGVDSLTMTALWWHRQVQPGIILQVSPFAPGVAPGGPQEGNITPYRDGLHLRQPAITPCAEVRSADGVDELGAEIRLFFQEARDPDPPPSGAPCSEGNLVAVAL